MTQSTHSDPVITKLLNKVPADMRTWRRRVTLWF
jgi:hypothetical protein